MRRLVRHMVAAVGVAVVAGTVVLSTRDDSSQAVVAVPFVSAAPSSVSLSDVAASATPSAVPAPTEERQSRPERGSTRRELAAQSSVIRRSDALADQRKAIAAANQDLIGIRDASEESQRRNAAADRAEQEAAERRATEDRALASAVPPAPPGGDGYDPNATPREIVRQLLANKHGYGPEQFVCFDNVIMRESRWIIDATNPSSGAYGIPQALPAGKMASHGSDWRTNPVTQVRWAIDYMNKRYGSPCQAWAFKRAEGWY